MPESETEFEFLDELEAVLLIKSVEMANGVLSEYESIIAVEPADEKIINRIITGHGGSGG